jgi:hypothetical protein
MSNIRKPGKKASVFRPFASYATGLSAARSLFKNTIESCLAEEKSRAGYFRRRRKTSPTRLVDTKRDAKRKREGRGGYKNYSHWKRTLSDEDRTIAEALFEYQQNYELSADTLEPIPFDLLPKDDKPVTIPSPIRGPPENAEDLPKALPLSASAKAQRRKSFQRDSYRSVLATWTFANSPEGAQWISKRWPGEEARVRADEDHG